MNAVQILTSARDRLARNRRNWITGCLVARRTDADDGKCYCSVGAVVHEGGGFTSDEFSTTIVSKMAGDLHKGAGPYWEDPEYRSLNFIADALTNGSEQYGPVVASKKYLAVVKEKLEAAGFAAKPTLTALAYLQAAAAQIGGNSVVALNDSSDSNENYQRVLTMFNVAIKNAKRRHRNGKRRADAKAVSL